MELEKGIYRNRLWELAQRGKSAEEIMRELDIPNLSILQNDLRGLMQEKGQTVNIPGLAGKATIKGRYTDDGTRIPPDMPARPEK